MRMIEWFRDMGGDNGEVDTIKLPEGFEWIGKPCEVRGEDFTYEATCLCSFPKTNGKVRYIVEDRGRLFIQREEQIAFYTQLSSQEPKVNSPEYLAAQREIAWGLGPKPEEPVTLAVLDDMDNERAGRPSQTIGEALELKYEREWKNNNDPLGR